MPSVLTYAITRKIQSMSSNIFLMKQNLNVITLRIVIQDYMIQVTPNRHKL